MKTWDAIIVGGGVIGLSLALDLRRHGLSVLVVEKHSPGHEASWAAGGMLAYCEAGGDPLFMRLAETSAKMYRDFVDRVQDESGINVDWRSDGVIQFVEEGESEIRGEALSEEQLQNLEPAVTYAGRAVLLPESWLDPRLLMEGLAKCARHLGVDIASGAEVTGVEVEQNRAKGVSTTKTSYAANVVVNCAGAWAGTFSPVPIPVKPIKGQMVSVVSDAHAPGARALVRHVIRGNGVYVIPRSDGRIVIGSTLEDVGFDKRVSPAMIQHLHQAAAILVPAIGQARILEDWAGLRPGSPDQYPIMGATEIDGYFVSTGHYRDGILLAPVSGKIMSEVIRGEKPSIDLSSLSLSRFRGGAAQVR